jgi:hypothetical protein
MPPLPDRLLDFALRCLVVTLLGCAGALFVTFVVDLRLAAEPGPALRTQQTATMADASP